MLIVKGDGLLDSVVGNGVTVSEILRQNTGARFVFLRNIMAIGICSCGGRLRDLRGDVIDAGSRADVNLRRSKLGVIEEKRSLASAVRSVRIFTDRMKYDCLRFFLEGHSCGFWCVHCVR